MLLVSQHEIIIMEIEHHIDEISKLDSRIMIQTFVTAQPKPSPSLVVVVNNLLTTLFPPF